MSIPALSRVPAGFRAGFQNGIQTGFQNGFSNGLHTAFPTAIDGHESPEVLSPQQLVHRTLLTVTAERAKDKVRAEDAFFVADLGAVYRQFRLWKTHLPQVKPFYAVKCNGDPQVLKLLGSLGSGFDCASQAEIAQVLATGVSPSRVVYANTIKHPSYLRHAREEGVKMLTFDSADELHKIKAVYPEADLLLRIVTDDSDAVCQLSCKFGAPLDSAGDLLAQARQLGLNVVGVAFHIGSGGGSVEAFPKALADARAVFDTAADMGFSMRVLDIGGGFETASFVDAAAAITASLKELQFGDHVEVMAEPGRFFVADAFTLATCVIGRRWTNIDANQGMLYVSDGVYGNLNCIIYDHQSPVPKLLEQHLEASSGHSAHSGHPNHSAQTSNMIASVWGPTCDGLDLVDKQARFPRTVQVGDWLYFENVGAYTLAASTTFNGFNMTTAMHYVCSEAILE